MKARAIVTGAVAGLATCGLLGMSPAAAQASSSSVPGWSQLHPAISPSHRGDAAMAYDAATGTMVLFGGAGFGVSGGTWTWDGSTWTQQHPAASPPARYDAMMAYDAATGDVLLFGGFGANGRWRGDTWIWGAK
jgi:hypothetical protein